MFRCLEPSVVPCRVTNPNIDVTLVDGQDLPISMQGIGNYDPTEGFIVDPYTELAGPVSCLAQLGSGSITERQSFQIARGMYVCPTVEYSSCIKTFQHICLCAMEVWYL